MISSTRMVVQMAEQKGFGLYVKEASIDGKTCHTLIYATRVWSADWFGV
jgi:hypothetical protein